MSDTMYDILAYHGWGLDSSIWVPLKTVIEPYVNFKTADRGYFSGSYLPGWNEKSETEKILFVHSYGLHWCDNDILQQANHLVILGSFLNFHPSEKKEYKRSKMLLRKMQAQFVDSPKTVLEKFYEEMFYPEETKLKIPETLHHDLLLSDLGDLDRDDRKNAGVFNMNSITIVHGAKDQIVDKELARTMFNKLRLRSQYFEIREAGHALPFTHSLKVFEILNSLFHFK